MIQILPCAGCNRALLLPGETSSEAEVECPHCAHQFVIGKLLEDLGTWKVLSDPGAASAATLTTAGSGNTEVESPHLPAEVSPSDTSSGELQLAGESSSDSEQAGKPGSKVNWSNYEPITHEQYERMKRKSRSPLWSMLQVVLGGVLAVPIALLILWHGLGKDVADAGPFVSQYAPWIVPEKFRPATDEQNEEDTPQLANQRPPNRGDSGFRQFDEVLPLGERQRGNSDGGGASAGDESSASPDRSASNDATPGVNPDVLNSMAAGDRGSSGGDAPGNPSLSGSPAGNNTPDTTSGRTPERNDTQTQQTQSENIFSLIHKSEQSLDDWRVAYADGETEQMKSLALEVYSNLVNLGVVIRELPDGAPVLRAVRDAMQPIGRTIKRQLDVQDVVEQGARFWVAEHQHQAEYGLAVIVEIESVTEKTNHWEIVPKNWQDLDEAFGTIRVPRLLAPSLISEQRLLMLGSAHRAPQTPLSSDDLPPTDAADADNSAPTARIFTASYLHAL